LLWAESRVEKKTTNVMRGLKNHYSFPGTGLTFFMQSGKIDFVAA
jgi:hypothetical protein